MFTKKHPRKKYIYAVTGGKLLGEMLVFCEDVNDEYQFLSLPQMKNRCIPKDKFHFGITENIVEVVDRMPSKVYKVCSAQFEKNKRLHDMCD